MKAKDRIARKIEEYCEFTDRFMEVVAPWLCGGAILFIIWQVWRVQ